jgi:transcriptional regulator of met regulon
MDKPKRDIIKINISIPVQLHKLLKKQAIDRNMNNKEHYVYALWQWALYHEKFQ